MVSLKLLAIVNTQLNEVKKKPDNNNSILGGLAIVILMGNFDQFPPIVRRPLSEEAITIDEFYGKAIQNHFTWVITLTQQMRQQNDKAFHSLLTRARKGLLNNNDVDTLINKIAFSIPTNNVDKNVDIVQRIKTRYIINRLQIKHLA